MMVLAKEHNGCGGFCYTLYNSTVNESCLVFLSKS